MKGQEGFAGLPGENKGKKPGNKTMQPPHLRDVKLQYIPVLFFGFRYALIY